MKSKWTPLHETPEPLEANDVAIVTGGTIVWLVLFLGQLPFYGWYADHGHAWWIWCCAAGAALGGVGILYVRRRRDAIRRAAASRDGHGDEGGGAPLAG
ncbi:DUF2530 domain-containing protein [Streptomyces sp. ICBB 8177]|uniref:DUF2530 domain-containing protein n=1 Tax=Streptomyces sp. ICBB 8177 TaxID=563922 RepID=UPI000D67BE04|nr:DUF2530 domain-containing protein [Streptomyces sp. ICBB 8177]PWI45887.1 DUF2530 domain-containing protein [Streptomyces sp. ICBB 8177]